MNNFKMVNEAQSQVVIEIKNLILDHVDKLKTIKRDLKNAKEMMNDAVVNSEKYREAKKEEEKYKRIKKAEQMRVEGESPEMMNKIDELNKEQREIKKALSDYLNEYTRLSGSNEIDINGDKVPIKRVASIQLKLF